MLRGPRPSTPTPTRRQGRVPRVLGPIGEVVEAVLPQHIMWAVWHVESSELEPAPSGLQFILSPQIFSGDSWLDWAMHLMPGPLLVHGTSGMIVAFCATLTAVLML